MLRISSAGGGICFTFPLRTHFCPFLHSSWLLYPCFCVLIGLSHVMSVTWYEEVHPSAILCVQSFAMSHVLAIPSSFWIPTHPYWSCNRYSWCCAVSINVNVYFWVSEFSQDAEPISELECKGLSDLWAPELVDIKSPSGFTLFQDFTQFQFEDSSREVVVADDICPR